MKNNRKSKFEVFLFLTFLLTTGVVNCQIPESERVDLENEAQAKLHHFSTSIKLIGEKNMDAELKDFQIESVLEIFKDDAIMEVSSTNTKKVKRYTVEEYLNRLKKLTYDNVTISFVAEALYFDLNSFYKLPNEEKYVGSSAIVQCFCGTYNNREMSKFNYCNDCTKKVVEIIIEKLRDEEGVHWRVLLGDVTVKETKKS